MGKLPWLVSTAAVVMLAACTAPPESSPELQVESESQGLLPREAVTSAPPPPRAGDPTLPFPLAGWLESGRKFAIVIGGSSSCPAYPSSLEVVDKHRMTIGIGTRGGPVCTSDWVGRTYVIRTPEGIDPTDEVTVQYGDTVVRLPAL
jgi:hypothetical protein